MYCDCPEFGRCCFCLPLRRGVLTFGYVSIFVSAFLVGIYSYAIHNEFSSIGYGRGTFLPTEVCLVLYLFEIIFDGVLIYGAHKKLVICLKAYYYFAVTTTVAVVILQAIDIFTFDRFSIGMAMEILIFTFAGLCIQLYLITIVRSLIKKLEESGPHVYENQLQQIVSGDIKVENGVYNNTTVVPTDV